MVGLPRLVDGIFLALAAIGFCADSPKLEAPERPAVTAPAAEDRPAETPAMEWIRLLLLESVQEELALSDQQKERIKEIGSRITERAREAQRLDRLPTLPAARNAALLGLAEQVRRELLKEILRPGQFQRLKQLAIQFYGVRSLRQSHVQQSLGLSPEQQARIEEIGRERAHQLHEIALAPSETGGIDWERVRGIEAKWDKALLATLTPDQREQFDRMAGPKFAPGFPLLLQREMGEPMRPQ